MQNSTVRLSVQIGKNARDTLLVTEEKRWLGLHAQRSLHEGEEGRFSSMSTCCLQASARSVEHQRELPSGSALLFILDPPCLLFSLQTCCREEIHCPFMCQALATASGIPTFSSSLIKYVTLYMNVTHSANPNRTIRNSYSEINVIHILENAHLHSMPFRGV